MKFIKLRNFAEEVIGGSNVGEAEHLSHQQDVENHPNDKSNDIKFKVGERSNIEEQERYSEFDIRGADSVYTNSGNGDPNVIKDEYFWKKSYPENIYVRRTYKNEKFPDTIDINTSKIKGRGYLLDPSKKAHGKVEGIYRGKNDIPLTTLINEGPGKDGLLGPGFKIPHDVIKSAEVKGENGSEERTWDINKYYAALAEQYNKLYGTSYDFRDFRRIIFDGAKDKRIKADVEDLRSLGATDSQINNYVKNFEYNPNEIPLYRLRSEIYDQPYKIKDFIDKYGFPRMVLHDNGGLYKEDERNAYDGQKNVLGYARPFLHFYSPGGFINREAFGTIFLKDGLGNDTSERSGPHEISHVTTSMSYYPSRWSKRYKDYMEKSKEMFESTDFKDSYASTDPEEMSRMWNELKLKLLMNGDIKPENLHDFRSAAPKLLQYFDEFENNPERVIELQRRFEFEPLREAYYIFKNLYKGDRNAWYNGEFKNYETAKNGRNAWQQNRNGGWLNTTPRTGLQRLAMGSYGIPA